MLPALLITYSFHLNLLQLDFFDFLRIFSNFIPAMMPLTSKISKSLLLMMFVPLSFLHVDGSIIILHCFALMSFLLLLFLDIT